MKKELKELAYNIASKYQYKYPQNVENQIKRFYKNYKNETERNLRKELIVLEWIIAEYNHL